MTLWRDYTHDVRIKLCTDIINYVPFILIYPKVSNIQKTIFFIFMLLKDAASVSSHSFGADQLANPGQKRPDKSSSAGLPPIIEMIPS